MKSQDEELKELRKWLRNKKLHGKMGKDIVPL
jgi:hypothetical protein